jgi:predicted component of type VI protein secretion system
MPSVCFNMSDEVLARAIAAYGERYDLDAVEGETKTQFARRMLAGDVRARIIDFEARAADAAVRATSETVVVTLAVT